MNQNEGNSEINYVSSLEKELQPAYAHYKSSVLYFTIIKISGILLPMGIFAYNMLFAGKYYSYSEYNTIALYLMIFVCITAGPGLLFATLLIRKYFIIKRSLKKLANTYGFPYNDVKIEFAKVAKSMFGGPGIV